jgi:hypothetical protein
MFYLPLIHKESNSLKYFTPISWVRKDYLKTELQKLGPLQPLNF